MAKSSFSGTEEIINHYGLVRLRVTGLGNLRLILLSLDAIENFSLNPIPLISQTNIEPTELANFTQQRAQLQIRTTEIDENFKISKAIVFVKPVAKSYPQ